MSEIIKLKSNQLSTTEHFYKKLTAIEFICKEALKISELKNPVISQKQLNYEIVDREYTLINLKISNIISYAYLNEKEVYERINNAFQNFLIVALYVNAKDNTATRAGKKISNTLNEFYKIIETFDAIKNKSTIVLEQIEYIKSLFKTVDGEIDSLSFIDGALVTSNSDQKIRFKRILLLQRQIFAADFIEHLNGLNKKDAIDSKEFIRLKTLLEYEMYYLSNAINTQTNNSLEKSNPKIVLKANENLNLLQKLKEQKSKIQNEINNATSYFYDDETRKNTFNEYRENLKNNEKWKFGIGLITLYGRNNPIAKDFAIELEKHIESEKCALIQKKLKERSDISLIEKEYEKHNFWTDKKQNFTDKKIEYTYSAVNAFMAANTAKTIIQLRGKGDTDNFWGEISLSALQIASSTLATMALGPLGGTLVDGVFKGLLYQDPEPDPFKKNVTKALNEINNGVKDLNDKITILQNELPATVKSATLSALKEKEFLDCISNVTTDINTLNSLYNRLIDPKISSDISYEKIIIIENDMVGNLNKILTLFLGDQLELKIGPGNIIEVKENKDANIENSVSFKLLESANREEIKKPTKFKKRIQ